MHSLLRRGCCLQATYMYQVQYTVSFIATNVSGNKPIDCCVRFLEYMTYQWHQQLAIPPSISHRWAIGIFRHSFCSTWQHIYEYMCSGDTDPMQIGGAKMICAFSIEKVLAEETHFIRDASIASERVAKGRPMELLLLRGVVSSCVCAFCVCFFRRQSFISMTIVPNVSLLLPPL